MSVYTQAIRRDLFTSPQAAGRKITAGFTYIQRITKAASLNVWFPDELKNKLASYTAEGQALKAQQFPAQWAAVRQFELLQEGGNHKIYDLDAGNVQRATLDLSRSMRGGGYRITVATLGYYQETSTGDELEILDHHLQERIAQMIHMLYLDTQSDAENAKNDAALEARIWDYRKDLPHISMLLGAQDLFFPIDKPDDEAPPDRKSKKGGKKSGSSNLSTTNRKYKAARQFFDILNVLPQNHIVHDTAIGLQLPELIGDNQWNYIASSDETLAAFNHVLSSLFDKFNGLSLSHLHERDDAQAEIKSSTLHLRSYGDHMTTVGDKFYRTASLAFG